MDEEERNAPEEEKSVKLPAGATVAVVVGFCFILIILIFTIRGCSIQKKLNSPSKEQTSQTVSTEASQTPSNSGTELVKPSENLPSPTNPVTGGVENSTSGNNGGSTGEQFPQQSDNGLKEVADAVFSDVQTNFGMVIGKHIYQKDGSYIYGVSISVIINEKSVSAEYFCPRKTYDELKSGDSLSVSYQLDSTGGISIYSISRG